MNKLSGKQAGAGLILTLIVSTCTMAQGQSQPADLGGKKTAAERTDTTMRLEQLESQVLILQAQVDALKALIERSEARPSERETNAATVESATLAVETPQKAPIQQKQIGVDLGSARLTPYGTIFFNAFGNSAGTNNTDVPLFATQAGAGNASATVRQTRFGLRLDGAKARNANLSAVMEADFFGGFPSVGIGENFGVVRLRLANVKIDWEKTSLTLGQDWMLFAPVNPTSLAAAAIPQLAAAGNPWARLPQVRVDHRFSNNLIWSGAVAAPQSGDFVTNAAFFLQPTTGASSRIPFFQTRMAFTDNDWLGSKKNGTIGFSGHYGRSRVFIGASNTEHKIDSAGLALDWNFPLHARLQFLGEAFWGRNLGGFQAGIFQGFNNDFALGHEGVLIPAGVRSIATRGGWAQLGFTPGFGNKLSIHGSIGIDDPYDHDLLSVSRRDYRSRNLAIALNSIYRVNPQFSISAEYRHFFTHYLITGRRNAGHINLAAAYTF